MLNKGFFKNKVIIKSISICVICLFMFNEVSFGLQEIYSGKESHTLSAFSRFNSIVSFENDVFKNDITLSYVSREIARLINTYGARISADGLKEYLEPQIEHIASSKIAFVILVPIFNANGVIIIPFINLFRAVLS